MFFEIVYFIFILIFENRIIRVYKFNNKELSLFFLYFKLNMFCVCLYFKRFFVGRNVDVKIWGCFEGYKVGICNLEFRL